MKLTKIIFAAVFAVAAFGNASAFHEGGVAYCDGCHTMHASEKGAVMRRVAAGATASPTITQYDAGPYLLQGTTQSAACLNCHQGDTRSSYRVATSGSADPAQRTPGGDFSWLKKTWTWVSRGNNTELGERHGHNVIAPDYSFAADTTLATGPGGNYPAANLHCSSCHDPHGRFRMNTTDGVFTITGKPIAHSSSYGEAPTAEFAAGAYRILAGVDYQPKGAGGGAAFVNDPPIAVAPSSYNRSEAQTMTRVAYGQGMSEWCANCHGGIHVAYASSNGLRHPASNDADLSAVDGSAGSRPGQTIAENYQQYKKTGDMTGTAATSFLSLVPFEQGTSDLATLAAQAKNDDTDLNGPTGSSNVMCLSCHRAHATGFSSMTRWENKSEFLTLDTGEYPDLADVAESHGKTRAQYTAAMNDVPSTKFSGWQRSLCNKCHAKD